MTFLPTARTSSGAVNFLATICAISSPVSGSTFNAARNTYDPIYGAAFSQRMPTLQKLVDLHEQRGNLLFWFCLAFAVIAVVAVLVLAGPSALASGKGAKATKSKPLELVTSAAVVVIGVLIIWQTIRTGDAGAKAVWDGQLPPN